MFLYSDLLQADLQASKPVIGISVVLGLVHNPNPRLYWTVLLMIFLISAGTRDHL